jgi:hypothetical protein
MKFLPASLLRRLLLPVAGLLLAAALPATAQNFTLDFVDDSGGGLTPDQEYVVFQGGWTGTLGGTSIVDYNGNSTTGTAYSFQSIETDGGFDITNAASGTAYILYGNTSLASFQAANITVPSPGGDYRYSFTEYNFNGTVGGSDITEIDQFGGSVQMKDSQYNGTGYVAHQSIQNTLDTGTAMRAILSNTSLPSSSPAVLTTGPGGTGNFVSIIGPSKFPGSYNGSFVNQPYPSYTPYLLHLNTTNSSSFLSNNLAGTQYGPIQLNGYSSNTSNSTITVNSQVWALTYAFNATTDSSGDIIFNGSVFVNGVAGGASGNYVYSNLYIVMPNDANLTPAIYLQNPSNTTVYGNLANSTVTLNGNVTGSASWGNLDAYVNNGTPGTVLANSTLATLGGNSVINLKVTGDMEEGMATGFVGSNASINNTTIASMSSAQWWGNATSAYTNGAQPLGSGYYNNYGVVNFANSTITNYDSTGNVTGTIVGGAIYTTPYDDRFGSNLMNINATDLVTITTLPDGNLSVNGVPEPAVDALVVSSVALLSAAFIRRSRLRSVRSVAGVAGNAPDRS